MRTGSSGPPLSKRMMQNVAAEKKRDHGDVQREPDQRDRSEMREKAQERKVRGDADDGVLRIARDRHHRADIRRGGYGDHVGNRRNLQAARRRAGQSA